jgi:hypothetical protein
MKPSRDSKTGQRFQAMFWVLLAAFGLYLVVGISLPREVTPVVNYNGSTLVRKKDWTDRDSAAFIVRKLLSPHERSEFLAQWVSLNARFTLRNLTEIVGFDRPINDMAVVESLLLVECRLGDYVPIQESFLNLQGHLVHYVSSRERKWRKMLEGSTVDRIARMLCEPSRY